MRGLKYEIQEDLQGTVTVALLVSAWIEISQRTYISDFNWVALLVSAWIEISMNFGNLSVL